MNPTARERSTVPSGYDKNRHGQLLLFPKSLKSFADVKIIGIKYDLFDEDRSDEKKAPAGREKKTKQEKVSSPKPKAATRPAAKAPKKKADPKPAAKKLIPFPAKKVEQDDDDEDDELKGHVRQAHAGTGKGKFGCRLQHPQTHHSGPLTHSN